MFQLAMDSSHYYRQHWYWWGEAHYRTRGGEVELTTIPAEEWAEVEAAAEAFWGEIAGTSDRAARIIEILKEYRAVMQEAGPPYRFS
jgi:hypothetical protein